MLALAFPPLDPVLVTLGPFAIRWYALAYLFGFIFAWWMCMRLARLNPKGLSAQACDDYMTWGVIGTILGGRLGYILFYQLDFYLENPLDILYVWHGGMSFHGGLLGVIVAAIIFSRKRKIPFFALSDILACVTPVGLFLGRLANFVNGELYGRVTDVPWAVMFPRGGGAPRHPSQLYEAGLEGIVLFVVLMMMARIPAVRARYGILSGVFLLLYGAFRFIVEFFREPDVQLGYLMGGATMGQVLCLPMMLAGALILAYALRRKA